MLPQVQRPVAKEERAKVERDVCAGGGAGRGGLRVEDAQAAGGGEHGREEGDGRGEGAWVEGGGGDGVGTKVVFGVGGRGGAVDEDAVDGGLRVCFGGHFGEREIQERVCVCDWRREGGRDQGRGLIGVGLGVGS